MVLATDIIHMMDDPGGVSHVNFDTPVSVFDARYSYEGTPEFAGIVIGSADGIDYNPGSDIDTDLITVGVTGIPKLWWDEATDSFEMNKSLTLPGGSLKLGAHVLSENLDEDDDGFDVIGTLHIHEHSSGRAGNIVLHEGTEPVMGVGGDQHRIWVDANHDIMWQDHLGVSSIIHVHGGTAQFNAEAIAAVEGEASLQFQQPTVISTKSGAGTITLQSVGNSVLIQAGIDIRMKSDGLFFDNKKFQIGTSKDYWFEYNTSGSRFRFWSRDIDGIGTDGVIFRILDGTQNVQFVGAVEVDTIEEFSSGVGVTLDGVLLKDGLVDSRDVAVDGTKLDGIESSATADQSDAEIKTAYENNADTNEFSDAEQTKLAGMSDGAGVPTKEFFIPAGAGILDSGAAFDESHIGLSSSGTFARCFFSFRLPTDFSSMAAGYPKVAMKPGVGGGGDVRIAFNCKSGTVGEQLGARQDSIAEYTKAMPTTSSELIEEDISAAVDGLSLVAGSYVEIQTQRDSDDVLDTLNGDLDIMGVIIKYS